MKDLIFKIGIIIVAFCLGLVLGINIVDAKYRDRIAQYRIQLQKSDYRPVTIVPSDKDRMLGIVIIRKDKDEAEHLFFPYPKKLNLSAMEKALAILDATNDAELHVIKQKYGIK